MFDIDQAKYRNRLVLVLIRGCVLKLLLVFPAYMSSPCHIELILAEREQAVPRPGTTEDEPVKKKVSQKKLKRQKMMMRD